MKYAVEARDLKKAYLLPDRRFDTIKERLATRSLRPHISLMQALNSVSFDVAPGEFFGIVGRNGSGKSTLLKLLAGIYRPDAGTVRMRGRIAPIIELGVGFHPELTAADNVILNGVVMGLTEGQAEKRLFRIVEFAGLGSFMGLKLKNFSSGMKVRLAFSIAIHVDAEVMLVDEVLAVGDGAFGAQSRAALRELHDAGRTIILVTHSMNALTQECDRAMLLEGGRVDTIGDPRDVAKRYQELMRQRASVGAARSAPATPEPASEPDPGAPAADRAPSTVPR